MRKVILSILPRRMTDELQRGFLTIFQVMDHCENLIKVMDSPFPLKITETHLPSISRNSSVGPYRIRTLWTHRGWFRKSERNEKRILKSQWNAGHLWSNSVKSLWNASLIYEFTILLPLGPKNNAGQRVWSWKGLFSITAQTQPPVNVKIDMVGQDNLWKLH